ncbi:hypothetical protein SPRG_17491, partial [Saprolegnia parasitica CBS 223.65]
MAKGGKKKGGKRKRHAWDDEDKQPAMATEPAPKKKFDSMFAQWKKTNVNRRNTQRDKALTYEQVKAQQYNELRKATKGRRGDDDEDDERDGSDHGSGSGSDDSASEVDEDVAPTRKKASTFQSF